MSHSYWQRGNHRIAVFGADGAYERSIGQEGEGPGDFMSPSLIVEKDGILRIKSNLRTTLYSTDGALIDVIQYQRGGNSIWVQEGYFVNIKSLYNPPVGTTMRTEALIKNTQGDTLAYLSTSEMTIAANVSIILRRNNSRRMRAIGLQYSSWPQILHLRDNTLLSYSGISSEIMFYDITGNPICRIYVDLPAEPATKEERQLVEDRYSELSQIEPPERGALPFTLNASDIPFPITKSPWLNIEVDDEEYIWLQESLPTFPDRPIGIRPIKYMVLTPDGEYLGITSRPIAEKGQVVKGYFLAIVKDLETDEMVPTVFRIRPTIEGLIYP